MVIAAEGNSRMIGMPVDIEIIKIFFWRICFSFTLVVLLFLSVSYVFTDQEETVS